MVLEKELYPVIEDFFKQKGYDCYKEVRMLSRQIDIIGVKKRKIIAVEAKVENWKRALQQALSCRLCAHEVYIAIWHDFCHRIPIELLKKYRIGLLSVKEDKLQTILRPKKSPIIHKTVMQEMLDKI